MRPHMDNINNPFGYTSAARPTWDTARPQPPPRRRANSLQHVPTVASTNMRPTRRSLFNTTVVCILFCCCFDLCVSSKFLIRYLEWGGGGIRSARVFIPNLHVYTSVEYHFNRCTSEYHKTDFPRNVQSSKLLRILFLFLKEHFSAERRKKNDEVVFFFFEISIFFFTRE